VIQFFQSDAYANDEVAAVNRDFDVVSTIRCSSTLSNKLRTSFAQFNDSNLKTLFYAKTQSN